MANVVQMDESTYRIEDGHVRFFLLIGTEAAAVVDSGMTTVNAKEIAEGLTDLPLILVNTHGDPDHVGGTGAFDAIFMAKEDYENCGLDTKFPETDLRELDDNEEISLGDRTLKVIKIPGHTKGSIALLDVEKRQLFAGDSVQNGVIYMFGRHRAPEEFDSALEKLIGLEDTYDCIVASHSEPVLAKDYAEQVLAGWRKVRAGEVASEDVLVHNKPVKLYMTEACGFYCQ